MGKINNRKLYPIDSGLSLDDYLIGSDADTTTSGGEQTKNYKLRGIFSTFKASLNLASLEFSFAGGSNSEIDETDAGYFSTNSNNATAGAITTIRINKNDLNGIDITSLVTTVSGNVSSFMLTLFKPSALGQIFYFQISNIVDNTTHYVFTVSNFVGGSILEDESTYSLNFDLAGVPSILTETDPVFTASPAATIAASQITNWDDAYSWGDHELEGYLTTVDISDITGFTDNSTDWNTAFAWGDHSLKGYLTSFSEIDPVFTASPAGGITSINITQWNEAYSWGNHALAGYIVGETDPVFSASVASNILSTDINEWNAAYQWGDHGSVGYLTSVDINDINTTGVADGTTFLRGDGAWSDIGSLPYIRSDVDDTAIGKVTFENGVDFNNTVSTLGINPLVVLRRRYISDSQNARGYADNTRIQLDSGIAYNSFDSFVEIEGTNNISGHISFQSRPRHLSSGTTNEVFGFGSYFLGDSGAVTDLFHFKAHTQLSGGTAVTNEYGIYIEDLTNAVNNYSIYTGTADSRLGGNLRIEGSGKSAFVNDEVLPSMKTESERQNKILGCVIRATGGTWDFISDTAHFNSGFTSVSSDSNGTITLNYDETFNKVISLHATTDETYAENEIFTGASVGLSFSNIKLFKRLNLNDYIFYNGSSFVSLGGVFTIDSYTSGVLTMSHRSMDGFDVQVTDRDSSSYINRIGSVGLSIIQIKFYNFDGTQYTGAANSNMKFFITRTGKIQLTASEASISGANIWVSALMQK